MDDAWSAFDETKFDPLLGLLLDAFNAGPDISSWVTAGNAMNTLAGKGTSVVAHLAATIK